MTKTEIQTGKWARGSKMVAGKGDCDWNEKKEGNGQWKERMMQLSILPFINFHPILPSNPLLPYKFTKKAMSAVVN